MIEEQSYRVKYYWREKGVFNWIPTSMIVKAISEKEAEIKTKKLLSSKKIITRVKEIKLEES